MQERKNGRQRWLRTQYRWNDYLMAPWKLGKNVGNSKPGGSLLKGSVSIAAL